MKVLLLAGGAFDDVNATDAVVFENLATSSAWPGNPAILKILKLLYIQVLLEK